MEKRVLSVNDAANILGLSRASVYEAIRLGRIPHVRIGRRILIPRTALEQMLESEAVASIRNDAA